MTTLTPDMNMNKAARFAGVGYLVIIITGILAEFILRGSLIIPGDSSATFKNIVDSQEIFRLSIASDLIMLFFDVALAVAFYIVLKPVNKSIALMAAFFRLAHSAIYGANLLNLFYVLQITAGAGNFAPDQMHSMVEFYLTGHAAGYTIGLVFFGVHCLILGYLIFKSGYIHKLFGILLIVAGLGYLIDSFGFILLPNYEDMASTFMIVVFVPAFIGELSLSLRLIIKGIKNHQPKTVNAV